jgi:hypothetical protein
MTRYLASFRRTSLVLGALTMCWGVTLHAQATNPTAQQRVALACTQGSDMAGCKPAVVASTERHSMHAQRDTATAKAPAQRAQAARSMAALDNDGSRFRYDSCGCSND